MLVFLRLNVLQDIRARIPGNSIGNKKVAVFLPLVLLPRNKWTDCILRHLGYRRLDVLKNGRCESLPTDFS
jgi:hypothetical protein